MLQLFVPLLAREQGMRGESRFWVTEEQHMMEHIGHELLTNMQRFTAQVLPIHIPHTHTHTHDCCFANPDPNPKPTISHFDFLAFPHSFNNPGATISLFRNICTRFPAFFQQPSNSQLEETVAAKSFPAFFQQPCKCPSDFGQFVQKIWVLEEPAA
jgi:hypothetical protein